MPVEYLNLKKPEGKRTRKESIGPWKAVQLQAATFNGPAGKYSARFRRATRTYTLFGQDN